MFKPKESRSRWIDREVSVSNLTLNQLHNCKKPQQTKDRALPEVALDGSRIRLFATADTIDTICKISTSYNELESQRSNRGVEALSRIKAILPIRRFVSEIFFDSSMERGFDLSLRCREPPVEFRFRCGKFLVKNLLVIFEILSELMID